jgi:uncharacterized protein
MAMTMECRFLASNSAGLQVRSEGDQPVIEGYGAVFYRGGDPGTEFQLWRDVYERIASNAFDRAIKEDRVRSLFNHDSNWVLGSNRGASPTLALSVDDVGLRYSVKPPATQLVRDAVLEPIRRGDVDGSSFMFMPRKVDWIEEDRNGVMVDVREIQEVELWEVGPVTFPAYSGTTIGLRAAEQDLAAIRKDLDASRRARDLLRRRDEEAAAAVDVALRMAGVRA